MRYAALAGWGAGLSAFIALCWWNASIRGTDEKAIRWALPYENLYSLRFKLGVLLWREGRSPEAQPYLQAAYQNNPESPAYGNALALNEWALGRHDDAFVLLQQVSRAHPEDLSTQSNLVEMAKRR